MKILLIDVDSKIPNIVLMKICRYYRNRGDEVGFNISNPDIIYASVIFSKNKHLVNGLKFFYPNAKLFIGGTGYDLITNIGNEIEYLKPDYDLYPDIDYSIGYTTRGCNRNCDFCIVHEKEGEFNIHQHPSEFYDDRFNK